MQIVKITPRGNATGVVIPAAYLRQLKWISGEYVTLAIEGDALVVRSVGQQLKGPRLVKRRAERRAHANA